MKLFDWDSGKSEWLRQVRGISFEEVVYYVQTGALLDVIAHQNPEKHPGQRILVVNVEEYVYLVSFVESKDTYFLKTIIPSRKMTRRYLRNRER